MGSVPHESTLRNMTLAELHNCQEQAYRDHNWSAVDLFEKWINQDWRYKMLPKAPSVKNEEAFNNPSKEQDKTEIIVPKHLVRYIKIQYTKPTEHGPSDPCNAWDADTINFKIGFIGTGGNNPFIVKFQWPAQRVLAEQFLLTCQDMFNFGWHAKGAQLVKLMISQKLQ